MSRFFSAKYKNLTPYTPGEQPQDRQFVKLNTNESPFPPSPFAVRLAREEAGRLELYSDPDCKSLVAAAADCLGVGTDEVVFGNGSDEILGFAFAAFCDDEHPAIFADITYGFYTVFAEQNRVPYTEIPLAEDYTLRVEDYLGVRGTVFIANPNAPTGIALPKREIERIVASDPDRVVVVDEAYVDFGAESCVDLIHKYDNLLVVQTFSKSRSLAGGRLGFAVGNAELIRDLNTLRFSTNPYNVNRMTMAAGVGALRDGEYFDFCCKKIMRTRERVAAELRALGFELTDSCANFLFARHAGIGGKALYLKLKEKGVLVRHFEKERLYDYNRITVGSDEQMDILLQAVREILGE